MSKPKGFSVENSKLLYQGKTIGDSICRPGFRQYRFEDSPLGEGANGLTFRVQHRVLGVEQVVKLYFPNSGDESLKARQEAIKNADPRIRNVAAQVHDAGTYEYPCEISYSIMESVSEIQTLREWLQRRDTEWDFYKAYIDESELTDASRDAAKSDVSRYVIAEALNVAAGYIGAIVKMQSANVTHGDLNPGNILINSDGSDPGWLGVKFQYPLSKRKSINDDEFERLHSLRCRYQGITGHDFQPGSLKPATVKLIDLGTSKVSGTDRLIGRERENYFILENLRKILKPLYFEGGTPESYLAEPLHHYLPTTRTSPNVPDVQPPVPFELASEVFRLLCVLNVFIGHSHNSRDRRTNKPSDHGELDETDLGIVNMLLSDRAADVRDAVFSLEVLSVLKELASRPGSQLVNWPSVLKHWSDLHPLFSNYTFAGDEPDLFLLRNPSEEVADAAQPNL